MVDSESRSRVSWEMSASRCKHKEKKDISVQKNENVGDWGVICVLVSGCPVIELQFLSHLRWVSDEYWLQKRIVSRYGRGFLSRGGSIRSEKLFGISSTVMDLYLCF